MPRLRVLSGAEVCRILEAHGFSRIRQKGSHQVMQRVLPGTTVTAVVANHSELRIGTLQSIIRQSQLPRSSFEA